jgi:hypothetical protein
MCPLPERTWDAPVIVGSTLYLGGAATGGSSVISGYDI